MGSPIENYETALARSLKALLEGSSVEERIEANMALINLYKKERLEYEGARRRKPVTRKSLRIAL